MSELKERPEDPSWGGLGATLKTSRATLHYVSLRNAEASGTVAVSRLPISMRILLENCLRNRHRGTDTDIDAINQWLQSGTSDREISFYPARVLMPDSSGVPLVADLAAMRDAVCAEGGDARSINPKIPVDIVVDHSAIVDHAGSRDAFDLNLALEYQRNAERYSFLKWAQTAFTDVRVVPPATGIVHQVNLEFLATCVRTAEVDGQTLVFPDTLVGMDSHTTMVNSIGVLGWGVGGIEAAAAMLGQPISMLLPQIVGYRLVGQPQAGVTCTDIVLTLTETLRNEKVVGKFVEFFGDGLDHLAVPDRATIANMAPEAGATMCFFPPDEATIDYLRTTGRSEELLELARTYLREQGIWRSDDARSIKFSDVREFDLGSVRPSMAGPKRPQDRVDLADVPSRFRTEYANAIPTTVTASPDSIGAVTHGSIVIAAITSCTNTSNARAMIGAGLIARKLRTFGVQSKPWVKTSLSPGSRVVTDYLRAAGLQDDLDALGFNLVGYGCMTCAGSSGQLLPTISEHIDANGLVVASVLSGNRNFEGRTHALVRANFLASPALVVAFACAGSITTNLGAEPIGVGANGRPVMLADVWPTDTEIDEILTEVVTPERFVHAYASTFDGDRRWQRIAAPSSQQFSWNADSTYIRKPPYFNPEVTAERFGTTDIIEARPLLILGDSITTDHISPVGSIRADTEAGLYLEDLGVLPSDFNTLLSRRANHDVMIRGTFANPRLRNEIASHREGPWTRHMPSGELVSVFQAAARYRAENVPLIIIAGKDYGVGSSRDWAAKGPRLLGVRAVIAESFERIHRSNLIGMGILPLQFPAGVTRKTLALTGMEIFSFSELETGMEPRQIVVCEICYPDNSRVTVDMMCRLDIPREVAWYRHGGILQYVAAQVIRTSPDAQKDNRA
jgi:aconitate hydratase